MQPYADPAAASQAPRASGGDSSARRPIGAPGRVTVRREQFAFFGDGGEYFRIWIVNILLTALTVGIYSAWAKVRTTQYFYRNARVAGASFEYHATPLAILKGRLIAMAMFGSYYGLTIVNPAAGLAAAVVLMAVFPFFVNRAMRFRLYNTSYRGLRFRFNGTTGEAYKVFFLYALGSVATLGLLAPMFMQRMKKYLHGNAAYGTTAFTFDASVGAFYRVYLATLGLALGLAVCAAAVVFPLFLASQPAAGGEPTVFNFTALALAGITALLGYIVVSVGAWAYMTASVQNLTWNSTQLGPHRFEVDLSATQLARILVTNWLGVVLTLGLYKPFADVRLAQYMMDSVAMRVTGNLSDFVAGAALAPGAVGEEALEMFDVELAV